MSRLAAVLGGQQVFHELSPLTFLRNIAAHALAQPGDQPLSNLPTLHWLDGMTSFQHLLDSMQVVRTQLLEHPGIEPKHRIDRLPLGQHFAHPNEFRDLIRDHNFSMKQIQNCLVMIIKFQKISLFH